MAKKNNEKPSRLLLLTVQSMGRSRIHWFIQTSSLQLGQLHSAMKFLFQCSKACPNCNCLVLKKSKLSFCPLTVVKTLFQMSVFFLFHYHRSFLKENLVI